MKSSCMIEVASVILNKNLIPVAAVILERERLLPGLFPCPVVDVERHRARVIHLEYVGEGPVDTTLLLVGKVNELISYSFHLSLQ